MEALGDLLFELSNEDRLRILYALQKEDLKLSHIAKKLDFTVQETTRNVARLVGAQMVNRTNYGSYEITPYGTQAVRLLDGYKFLSRHVEYFATHSLKELPQKFQNRLGELNDSEPVNRIMDTFGGIEKMTREAEEYYLYITQETLTTESGIQYTLNALDNGVKGKGIKPTGFTRPRIIEDTIPDEVWKEFRSHNQKGSLEHKYLESIDIALFMSEKEVFFDFPDNAGNYDYLGFTSTDAKALDWGKDVFEYYWERASLINSV